MVTPFGNKHGHPFMHNIFSPQCNYFYFYFSLHKENTPIRTIINWKNVPAYELAKQLLKILHSYPQLAHIYNVRNSIHLMTDIQAIEPRKDMRLCSFDVGNMYTNT
jgi:hypothetical protein